MSHPSGIHDEIYVQNFINIKKISSHKSDVFAERVVSENCKILILIREYIRLLCQVYKMVK